MAAACRLGAPMSVVKCYSKHQCPNGWSWSCNFSNWGRRTKPTTKASLTEYHRLGVMQRIYSLSSFFNCLSYGSNQDLDLDLDLNLDLDLDCLDLFAGPLTFPQHVDLDLDLCCLHKIYVKAVCPRTLSTWNKCGQSIYFLTSCDRDHHRFRSRSSHFRQAGHDKPPVPSFSIQSKSMGLNQRLMKTPLRPLCDINVFAALNPKVSEFSLRTYTTKRAPASHYDILGLTPKASQKQIKSAYYKMSKLYHPDVSKGRKSHAKFTEINEAYEVLGNIQKRRLYDRGLLHERDPRSPYNPHDMDFPGTWARQSPFERGDRPPPPRGRSTIYNFDEFYKQHYNEVRQRRSREWSEYMKYQEMKKNPDVPIEGFSIPLLISASILVFVLIFIMTETYGYDLGDYHERKK